MKSSRDLSGTESIQDAPAWTGFGGDLGIVELGVALYIELLHYGRRFQVGDGGEGREFCQMKLLKAERNGCLRLFARIAQPPVRLGQAPSHCHARRKWKGIGGNVQPDKADASFRRPFLNRSEAPLALVDETYDSLGEFIALLPGSGRRINAGSEEVRGVEHGKRPRLRWTNRGKTR